MGLPPDWTKYGADGEEIRNSSRYAALGNSVALPCAEYIMEGDCRSIAEINLTVIRISMTEMNFTVRCEY